MRKSKDLSTQKKIIIIIPPDLFVVSLCVCVFLMAVLFMAVLFMALERNSCVAHLWPTPKEPLKSTHEN
jgi:hypothetical protein